MRYIVTRISTKISSICCREGTSRSARPLFQRKSKRKEQMKRLEKRAITVAGDSGIAEGQ